MEMSYRNVVDSMLEKGKLKNNYKKTY